MKSKRQKQLEAKESLKERLRFWEEMARTGKSPEGYAGFVASNNDIKLLDRYLDMIEGRKALANIKIVRLTKDLHNLQGI